MKFPVPIIFKLVILKTPKRGGLWINDLLAMYNNFASVNLWCERSKACEDEENEEQMPKRKKKRVEIEQVQDDLDDIFHDLRSNI